jgi:hypothetical protein
MHYQDDLFIKSKNIRDHLEAHRVLFDRAREANMVFSLRKSHFNYYRLRVLSHIITVSGRTPDPEKIASILDLKDPENDAQIMHFVGLTAINRDYIYRAVGLTATTEESFGQGSCKICRRLGRRAETGNPRHQTQIDIRPCPSDT